MTRVQRIVIVPYSAAAMYALADDIERYPQFLPWCAAAEVTRDAHTQQPENQTENQSQQVQAILHIRYLGLSSHFATANIHTPFSSIDMQLTDGPLTALSGGWRFADLGDGRSRVEFDLQYAFAGGVMGALFAKVFAVAFSQFVECFVARARDCYGEAGVGLAVSFVDAGDMAAGERQLHLPAGATVEDALREVGRLDAEAVGIFGRACHRQTPLYAGARVEIYCPLVNDPREARRVRSAEHSSSKKGVGVLSTEGASVLRTAQTQQMQQSGQKSTSQNISQTSQHAPQNSSPNSSRGTSHGGQNSNRDAKGVSS